MLSTGHPKQGIIAEEDGHVDIQQGSAHKMKEPDHRSSVPDQDNRLESSFGEDRICHCNAGGKGRGSSVGCMHRVRLREQCIGKANTSDVGHKANIGRIQVQTDKRIVEFAKDVRVTTPLAERELAGFRQECLSDGKWRQGFLPG
jgi:hypothetical protein